MAPRIPIELSPGVTLLGKHYLPDNGVFILHNNGEAVLVECPPDPRWPIDAVTFLKNHDLALTGITTSHLHEDHFDMDCLEEFAKLMGVTIEELPWWQSTEKTTKDWGYYLSDIGGEPLWSISCAKHSRTDQVLIFRGFALTGDIELGVHDSCNMEVSAAERAWALHYLANFEAVHKYKIHGLCSAHANDLRYNIAWPKVVLPMQEMRYQPRSLLSLASISPSRSV